MEERACGFEAVARLNGGMGSEDGTHGARRTLVFVIAIGATARSIHPRRNHDVEDVVRSLTRPVRGTSGPSLWGGLRFAPAVYTYKRVRDLRMHHLAA